jgi:transglutaminase-like putative cysteine protease
MKGSFLRKFLVLLLVLMLLVLAACDQVSDAAAVIKNSVTGGTGDVEEDPDAPDRDNTPKVLPVEATGEKIFEGSGARVDYSNAADGYVMVKYKGESTNVKVQITFHGAAVYTYDLRTDGNFEAFPLSQGSGTYSVGVFTNIAGDQYAQAVKKDIKAEIKDEFSPFLRPSQYVNFDAKSAAVAKAADLSKGAKSDLGAVKKMFDYVVENISYDYPKAENVESGYLPNVDDTLKTGTGICFDYASLMSAMFRSQGIPTKLVVGYADTAYHAWIQCYVDGKGWIVKIEFSGANWYFMDPTFTASGDKADPNLVGSGTNYNPVYYY